MSYRASKPAMSKYSEKCIYSRKGFRGWPLTVSFFVVSATAITVFVQATVLKTRVLTIVELIAVLFMSSILWSALNALVLKIAVSQKAISVKNLRHNHTFLWEDVNSIKVIPNGFWSYNMTVTSKEKPQSIFITTSGLANCIQIIKASLDAAYAVNPDIQFEGVDWLGIGSPPYGIFNFPDEI